LQDEKGSTARKDNDSDDDNEDPKASPAGMWPRSPHFALIKKINEFIQKRGDSPRI
jgi:hypothetical protein